jgi:hypothetical protein
MLNWIIARLMEPTSYAGIGMVLAAVGVAVSPELAQHIQTLGLGIGGLLAFFLKERGAS